MSGILDLMQRARAASSLDDFGDDSFREGLERLVESADREARLTERGRMGFELQIVDLHVNRLQVENRYRLHPEIDQQQIGRASCTESVCHYVSLSVGAVPFTKTNR